MSLSNIERAARWDILIQQGSSFVRTLQFDADISTMSFRGQIRATHVSATALASFVFTPVDTTTVTLALTPADTAALPDGDLVYDIEAHNADDSFVVRLLEGRARVTPEVSR